MVGSGLSNVFKPPFIPQLALRDHRPRRLPTNSKYAWGDIQRSFISSADIASDAVPSTRSHNSFAAMNALTTVYTPPAWCADRYAVFIATPPWDSTNVPSSGWVDPSFTKCIPSQYSSTYPSFSPGICPQPMTIVASESNVSGRRTVWTGRCCQR